jgi:transcriptional regulator with XRE-family HTH domain
MTMREELAKKLKEYRQNSGMSVKEVGALVGKSDKTVSAWEVGRGQPDADLLMTLCSIYSVGISDFYGEEAGELNKDELEIIELYRNVNAEGKEKIAEYAALVSQAPEYKKAHEPSVAEEAG